MSVLEKTITKLTTLLAEMEGLYSKDQVMIKPSNIHGDGIHAMHYLPKNFYIGQLTFPKSGEDPRIKFQVTAFGSKLNHSDKPNCIIRRQECGGPCGYHTLFTTRNIKPGEELTVNYRKTKEFKQPEPGWK